MGAIDEIVRSSLLSLWRDPHVHSWRAKEHDWVSYYVFRHLSRQRRKGTIFWDLGQVAIEGGVPQPRPKGRARETVRRDVVLWRQPGATCWNDEWEPCLHPLAIVEWKVHRPGHRNRGVSKERDWLSRYCRLNRRVYAYAVEIDGTLENPTLSCARFRGEARKDDWLLIESDARS